MLPVSKLQDDLKQAEHDVTCAARVHGEGSPEYIAALKRLSQTWYVLKMSRRPGEFLDEVVAAS
jgi:hypothetical protein